jgi:5'-deoxynucleotidase YfbR-like HD superfamily hydrolase
LRKAEAHVTDFVGAWLSGTVKRYHTMESLQEDSVAQHSWGVVLLLIMLWPSAPSRMIIAAELHDFGEKATGDMPGPVKWSDPVLEALLEKLEHEHMRSSLPPFLADVISSINDAEWALVELCDRAEFCIRMIHERKLGNRYAEIYYKRAWDKMTNGLELYRDRFQQMSPKLVESISELRRNLDSSWREVRK